MRKLIIVVLISLFGHIAGVQASAEVGKEVSRKSLPERVQLMESCRGGAVDCTIHVNFTTDDGTRIEGELTFVDIPWWECAAIKIGNFLSRIF